MCTNSKKDIILPCGFFTVFGLVFGILSLFALRSMRAVETRPYRQFMNGWIQNPIQGVYVASTCDESLINFTFPLKQQDDNPRTPPNLIEYNMWPIDVQPDGSYHKTSVCIDRANSLTFQELYLDECDLSYNRLCSGACVPSQRLCPIFAITIVPERRGDWEERETVTMLNLADDAYIYFFREPMDEISSSGLPLEQFSVEESVPCYEMHEFSYSRNEEDDRVPVCDENPDFRPVGLQTNEKLFFDANQADLKLLKQNGFIYSPDHNLTVYQKPYSRLDMECRQQSFNKYIMDQSWMDEIERAQLVVTVFCLAMACFEVICVLPFAHRSLAACCGFNFVMLIVNCTSVIVASGITLNTLIGLRSFCDLVASSQCTTDYFVGVLKSLTSDYRYAFVCDIVILSAFSCALLFLFAFHLYRTYISPDGIAHTSLRPKGPVLEGNNREGLEIFPAHDIEYIKKQGKVLCACFICLSNTPPPQYTQCCGQPMHTQCNCEQITKCPNCQRQGRVQLVPFVLYESRAFMNRSQEIAARSKSHSNGSPTKKNDAVLGAHLQVSQIEAVIYENDVVHEQQAQIGVELRALSSHENQHEEHAPQAAHAPANDAHDNEPADADMDEHAEALPPIVNDALNGLRIMTIDISSITEPSHAFSHHLPELPHHAIQIVQQHVHQQHQQQQHQQHQIQSQQQQQQHQVEEQKHNESMCENVQEENAARYLPRSKIRGNTFNQQIHREDSELQFDVQCHQSSQSHQPR